MRILVGCASWDLIGGSERYARAVGPERLMAGVDCGFSVHVGTHAIDPDVAFAKLASLADGAALASERLF